MIINILGMLCSMESENALAWRNSSDCLLSLVSLPIITVPRTLPSSSFMIPIERENGNLRPSLCTRSISLIRIPSLTMSARRSPSVERISGGSIGSSTRGLPTISSAVYPRSLSTAGLVICITKFSSVITTTSAMLFMMLSVYPFESRFPCRALPFFPLFACPLPSSDPADFVFELPCL